MAPQRRKHRDDRLTHPGTSSQSIAIDFACGPLDELTRAMDRKWGVDRLPELVPVEMAARYGKAVAALNAALDAQDVEAAKANAANVMRGLSAMDAEAERAGATRADQTIWEYEVDGFKFAILRDDRAWPAVKAARPDLVVVSIREVANALREYTAKEIEPAQDMRARTYPPIEQLPAAFWKSGGDQLEGLF